MTPALLFGVAASFLSAPADSTRPKTAPVAKASVARPANAPAIPIMADSVVVEKSARTLVLYERGLPVRIYFVALGQDPVGDKVKRGDNRTPEGLFRISGRNPDSKFHLALRISYPDERHMNRAREMGVDAGGDIMIHGLPNGAGIVGVRHREQDWTNGCIALTNEEIEEIWWAIPDGTPIHIKP